MQISFCTRRNKYDCSKKKMDRSSWRQIKNRKCTKVGRLDDDPESTIQVSECVDNRGTREVSMMSDKVCCTLHCTVLILIYQNIFASEGQFKRKYIPSL